MKRSILRAKQKQYVDAVKKYHGNLLPVGISPERESEKHHCEIEKRVK